MEPWHSYLCPIILIVFSRSVAFVHFSQYHYCPLQLFSPWGSSSNPVSVKGNTRKMKRPHLAACCSAEVWIDTVFISKGKKRKERRVLDIFFFYFVRTCIKGEYCCPGLQSFSCILSPDWVWSYIIKHTFLSLVSHITVNDHMVIIV